MSIYSLAARSRVCWEPLTTSTWLAWHGTPILAGLGLLAIVSVLRVGERMQRDTEGLV